MTEFRRYYVIDVFVRVNNWACNQMSNIILLGKLIVQEFTCSKNEVQYLLLNNTYFKEYFDFEKFYLDF